MLHLIVGTAGTGKTTRLMEQLERSVREGGKAILLVPEQLSFESEKLLYRSLGPRLSLQVEVLSFTRLCNSIFRGLGGLSDPAVSHAAKYLLMSIAVDELQDGLKVYRKSCVNTAFLETLVETCAEFKTAGISPERLLELTGQCDDSLREKLDDLGALYTAYQALLSQGYTDPDDDLIRACALLENRDFFSPYYVFVDGFTTFMAAEFELLGHIIAQAREVTFAMTADGEADPQQGMGVFSPVKSAIRRLRRLAEKNGITVADVQFCTTQKRFRHRELGHIAAHFLQPGAPAYEGKVSAVTLRSASDPYGEAQQVAAGIAALVRDKGIRYREIAVVARDTDPYRRAIESAFGRYEIPYFLDNTDEVENQPLAAGLMAAVDAVRSNFDAGAVLLLAKSPILGLDPEAVAVLENYCYLWGVRGAVFTGDFANNPRGLAGALTEEDEALLRTMNETRRRIIDPLARLRDGLKKCSAKAFAAALYHFLEEVQAAENLTKYAQGLDAAQRATFLDLSAQMWDILMDILDIFGSVLGGGKLSQQRLCELFRLAVNAAEVGMVPQTLDQVLVGKADRIRPVKLRAVFVIGANEGVFPAQVTSGGVFSDAERKQMIDAGVEIGAPSLQKTVLERFFAYFALTLGSERLCVSWCRSDLAGRELLPSLIVSQLQELLPGLEETPADFREEIAGERSAFSLLAEHYREDRPETAALLEYFSVRGKTKSLQRMERASQKPPHSLMNRELARGLFGNRMRLSPTRVERYYRCPFSFFAADGLSLQKRRRVEFSPLESGSVIHNVLQVMVQRHGGAGLNDLTDEQLKKEIASVIEEYLASKVEDVKALPVRFQYLFRRLAGMLARLLRRLGKEFAQSQFQPVEFELPISAKDGVEPLQLQTADGVTVMVEGVVDRVDVMEKNGARYVRVVDYKSGSKSFALHDVLYGLNLQMLLYLFTIQENGTGELAGAIPAGVLYMPVREAVISAGREESEEKVAQEREKQWRMSGLLLEDEEALRGMEQDVAGVFIPAKLTKSGALDAKSSLAGKAEMGRLSRKVKELVVQMASSLQDGRVQSLPVDGADYDTCQYCDYRSVCGFEPGDPVREIAKADRKEVLEKLEEEEHAQSAVDQTPERRH